MQLSLHSIHQHSEFCFPVCVGSLRMLRSKSLAPVVGGALGGTAAVIMVMFSVLYYWKRHYLHRHKPIVIDTESVEPSFQPTTFIENSRLQIVEGAEEHANTWLLTSLLHKDVDIQTQTKDTSSSPTLPKSSSSSKPEPSSQPTTCITNPCLQVEDHNECADAWSPTTLVYEDINIRTQTNNNLSLPIPPKSNLPSEGTATAHITTSSAATVTSQNYLSSLWVFSFESRG